MKRGRPGMKPAVTLAAASAMALVLFGGVASGQGGPERFTAWAVNMGAVGPATNATVQIQIDKWSPEADRDRFITTLIEKGPDAMLRELQKSPRLGFIRLPNSLGHDLYFARQVPLPEGGRRIVIATDRKIGYAEARNQPRTIDYPFTLIEIRVNKDGVGEGKMAVATKITHNKKDNILELENYSSEPVRL